MYEHVGRGAWGVTFLHWAWGGAWGVGLDLFALDLFAHLRVPVT